MKCRSRSPSFADAFSHALLVVSAIEGGIGCGGAIEERLADAGGGSSAVDAAAPQLQDVGATSGPSDLGAAAPAVPASLCDAYFTARFARCGGPVVPEGERARIRARFDQSCMDKMALRGSGMTPSALASCEAALSSVACDSSGGYLIECSFQGTLPGGAECADDVQCQSGRCANTVTFNPEGPDAPYTCGQCSPISAVGETCDGPAGCPAGAICVAGNPSKSGAYTCTPVTAGDVGASCDDLTATCKSGSYCAPPPTRTCEPLVAAGATCGQGGALGGCQAPLSCVGGPDGNKICASGAAGAFCVRDSDCSSGLGCMPGPCSTTGCSSSGTCMPVTWVGAGASCDGQGTRCLVGTCGNGALLPPSFGPDGGPIARHCPSVIADGQPCDIHDPKSTCDTFSECFQGTCMLVDSYLCQ